ncbi:PREDICTED: LOC110747193 partial [Prunus dulcis]|uniref:PREDICTED: LOC110747193 partial n=1 Tax=Prunus dulcis TaxID=3755 RepID=A0A5E4EJK1_PRUDU|nr:PREDICTED: LOC110747193 partial [Prunus dulcis]
MLIACQQGGFARVMVESDFLTAIQMVNKERLVDAEVDGLIFNIHAMTLQKAIFIHAPRSCNKAVHEVASFDEKELQINQNVSGNVHEKARQGRGSEAAAKPCGHVWGLGRCDPGRPLRSSLPLR